MVHPVLVSSGMRGMGQRPASMSNLKLSGKLPKVGAKLCKLPPILEPTDESGNEGSFRGMKRGCQSVPDLQSNRPDSGRGVSRESKEERIGGSRRSADPFHDFLHGSPQKMPSKISKVGESEDDVQNKKVTKATIAEEIRRLRQDDRDFKQGFRSLQAKSSMIKHEGMLSGGVSLLQGDIDTKPALSRSKNNVKLPSLPTANHELLKLQELMKKQQRELGFLDDKKEEADDEKEFKSAFRSLLK